MILDGLQRRPGEVKGKEEPAQIAEWTAKEFCSIQKRNPKRGERFDVISTGRFLAFDLSQGRCWPIWRTDLDYLQAESKPAQMPNLGKKISVIDGRELPDQVDQSGFAIHAVPVERPRP